MSSRGSSMTGCNGLSLLSGCSCSLVITGSKRLSLYIASVSSSVSSCLRLALIRRIVGYCSSLSLIPSLILRGTLSLSPSLVLRRTLTLSPSLVLGRTLTLFPRFSTFGYDFTIISVLGCDGLGLKGFGDSASIMTFFNLSVSFFFDVGSTLVILSFIVTLVLVILFHIVYKM